MIKHTSQKNYILLCDFCAKEIFFNSKDEINHFLKNDKNKWKKDDENQIFCDICSKDLYEDDNLRIGNDVSEGDIFYLIEIIENAKSLLGKNIFDVIQLFDLKPRYGLKKYGIQIINKHFSETNLDVQFYYFNEIFYKTWYEKQINGPVFLNILAYFEKKYGKFTEKMNSGFNEKQSSHFVETEETISFYRKVRKNIIIRIDFIERTYEDDGIRFNIDFGNPAFSVNYYLTINCYHNNIANIAENKMENYDEEFEWFNSFEYLFWENIAEDSIKNNMLDKIETEFLMKMGKMRKYNRRPSYKQIMFLKNIYEKYNKKNIY
jgi:hypothetical protein